MTAIPTDTWLKKLPKIELHVHLDGSLRPALLWDILEREGNNPFSSRAELEKMVRVPDDVAHLSAYLQCFDFILKHLQRAEDIERAAFELAEDSSRENIRYLEVRFSPILHLQRGSAIEEIIEAALQGLKRAESAFQIKTGLIVCCIREQAPESSVKLARAALKYKKQGMAGIDLAGDEYHFPGSLHRQAFEIAYSGELPITVHAGEVKGAGSIREAVNVLHARRIGHGIHLEDDQTLLKQFADRKIPLEICLTTNVHTKAVESFTRHPLKRYLEAGLAVNLNSDDRLMSNITLTREFIRARDHLQFNQDDFLKITEYALDAVFLPAEEKQIFRQEFLSELEEFRSGKK